MNLSLVPDFANFNKWLSHFDEQGSHTQHNTMNLTLNRCSKFMPLYQTKLILLNDYQTSYHYTTVNKIKLCLVDYYWIIYHQAMIKKTGPHRTLIINRVLSLMPNICDLGFLVELW